VYPAAAPKYFAFRGAAASRVNTDWTKKVFKNGVELATIAVSVRETSASNYVATFTDDGTYNCRWDLVLYPTAAPTEIYRESFYVQQFALPEMLAYMRNAIDSLSSFVRR
jgi:hypothetical protein